MSQILVIGGAGFMASHLVLVLRGKGARRGYLTTFGRPPREPAREVDFIYGDVTNPAAVEQAFDGVDACFQSTIAR